MSGNLGGANVEIRTKADTSELRQAIKDYKDGKISVEDLRKATDDLKASVKDQNLAIRAVTQANRVNFYELNEGLRVMRQATSVFRDINSVMQILTLKSIDNTTVTVQQQQAYDNLKTSTENIVEALSVLGSSNTEVKQGFSDIISQAGKLNSVQLSDLINNLDTYKKSIVLTPDELSSLNQFENKLKDIRNQTIKAEDAKHMQDFVTQINSLALTAGSIGTFAINLAKIPAAIRAIQVAADASPIIGSLAAILELARQGQDLPIQTAGGGEPGSNPKTVKDFNDKYFGGPPDITSRFTGDPRLGAQTVGNTTLHMNISNLTIAGETDIETFAKRIMDYINHQQSLGAR